jgi:hypothetical protein
MSATITVGKTNTKTNRKSNGLSKASVWTGRILGGLAVLFFLFDAAMKLIVPVPTFVAEATAKLGYPVSVTFGLGVVLLISTLLYAIPRTSFLGAILLTGYLGGAVSTHVRVQDGAFNALFPVIFGAIVWGGLYLRDPRVRALVLRRNRS